jgi:hypothetical protein
MVRRTIWPPNSSDAIARRVNCHFRAEFSCWSLRILLLPHNPSGRVALLAPVRASSLRSVAPLGLQLSRTAGFEHPVASHFFISGGMTASLEQVRQISSLAYFSGTRLDVGDPSPLREPRTQAKAMCRRRQQSS